MISNSSLTFLLLSITVICVNADTSPKVDKTPWKPITSRSSKSGRRQYNPASYPSSHSHSHSYSGRQQSLVARPVTYVPPAVTFNPPQLVYGNPSVTRAVPSSSSSHYRQNSMPSYSNPYQSASQLQPSYAAPVQPYEYHPVATTTPSPQIQSVQFQLITQPSSPLSTSRSYAPSHQTVQYQLVHQPSGDAPPAPSVPNPYAITTATPSTSPRPPAQSGTVEPGTSPVDNATFVDVVTVLSKYFRATGTQLSEMFTQLSNNTELNTWSYGWGTTSTTTTTPKPAPAPANPAPVVVPTIIMMPAPAPAPAPPSYSMPPPPPPIYSMPPPPPPMYQPPPPPPSYHQPQPAYSQLQPSFVHPPPMFSHPPPTYHHHQQMPSYHQPMFPEGKSAHNAIIDNSIDHDYYYDCDK